MYNSYQCSEVKYIELHRSSTQTLEFVNIINEGNIIIVRNPTVIYREQFWIEGSSCVYKALYLACDDESWSRKPEHQQVTQDSVIEYTEYCM